MEPLFVQVPTIQVDVCLRGLRINKRLLLVNYPPTQLRILAILLEMQYKSSVQLAFYERGIDSVPLFKWVEMVSGTAKSMEQLAGLLRDADGVFHPSFLTVETPFPDPDAVLAVWKATETL